MWNLFKKKPQEQEPLFSLERRPFILPNEKINNIVDIYMEADKDIFKKDTINKNLVDRRKIY